MSDLHTLETRTMPAGFAVAGHAQATLEKVMSVLLAIRSAQSDGLPYDRESNLTDAGFTSVEMVNVMLGIEAAFDLMIPQDEITPENFATPAAIALMIGRL